MSTEEASKKDLFVKGHTWGSYELSEDRMRFSGESKKWFDIPLKALSNVQQGGNKNEIALEFNKDEDIEDSAICEIKLFVPEKQNKIKEKEKEEKKDENMENGGEKIDEEEEEEKPSKTGAELLKEEIMKIAGIGSVTGAIAQISDFQSLIPRGKFDIFFLKNSLKMSGQSHNYQIQTKNISKLFLVPKAEGNYSLLILKLKSPVTQGNVSYPFIIFQVKAENEISIDLQIPEDDEDLNNVEDFQSPLSGKTIDVISKLFHKIMNKGLIIPSKTLFSKGPFVKCSFKANDGVLYFFEKSFLFVQKPVLEIEHDTIKEVDIARIQAANMQQRTFDITIKLKKDNYQFSGIDMEEIDILKNYMNDKKINLKMKDEDNNNIEMLNYTSTRRRAPVSDELPNLPSEEELGDGDYSDSGEDNEDYQEDEDDEEEEEEEEKKEKKKNKNKKRKVE